MASKKKVFNTTDSPVVLDDEGHTLGGFESDEVEETEFVSKALIAGRLIDQAAYEAEASQVEAPDHQHDVQEQPAQAAKKKEK